MAAPAYKHFYDAAILATILRDLPAVVSAAADPIGKIDNLTVLSTDGASEIVRTATTNLTQAGHAIKGLTGIDIPAVFGNALDNANLTGTSEERALRVRTEPATAADADQDVGNVGTAPTERSGPDGAEPQED